MEQTVLELDCKKANIPMPAYSVANRLVTLTFYRLALSDDVTQKDTKNDTKNDTKSGFEKEVFNPKIKHIKYGEGQPSHSFYAFLLPKKTEYGDDAYTIKNCYEPEKFQEAFKQAMTEKEGHFAGLSIDRIADDIKNKAKTILADHAKSFDATDFEGFKPIFDLVDEIREL